MATRMQQRRGTEEQWTIANPVLAAGEIGFETDTSKFKLGDGVNAWADLPYFVNIDGLSGELEGYILETEKGAALGVATLDNSGKVPSSQLPDIDEISQDAIDAALVGGNGITKTYDDEANTITLNVDTDVIADKSYVDTAESDAISSANSYTDDAINALDTDDIEEGTTNKYYSDTLARGAVSAGEGLDYNSANGTFSADLGNGLQFDVNGQIEIDDNVVATQTDLSTDIGTHSSTTSGVHGVTGDVVGTVDAQTLTNKDLGSGTTLSANLDASGFTVTDLATPVAASDAATKGYVDAVSEGLHVHASVAALADSNVSLPTAPAAVDGVTLSVNDRVLLVGQTAPAENGIYVVINGDLARAADYNTAEEIDAGDFVFVSGGAVYGSTGWVQENAIATLGTDPIEWSQFSGAGTYSAGNGLTFTGTEFAIDTTVTATKTYVDDEIDAHTELTSAHGVAGDIVGTSDTQTLTNKTLGSGTVLGADLDGTNTYKVVNLVDPTSNQDAATKKYVDDEISGIDLSTKQDVVSGVSSTEIGYLDGVTSPIQTQLNDKAAKTASVSQKSTNYTLQASDAGSIIEATAAATITIPADETANFPVGSSVDIVNAGAGEIVLSSEQGLIELPNTATTWTTATSNFGTSTINSIAYGNGLWVAGGYTGQMRISTNGSTWTTVTSNFGTTNIRSVAFGNSLWVAGGYSGQMRTSTDGSTWTTATSNFGTAGIFSIAYANNLWVAGGSYGQMRTSTDGSTWTTATSNFGQFDDVHSITFGNDVWVAVGASDSIRTSTNGSTWTTVTSNFSGGMFSRVYSVAYANNIFVAVQASGQIRTSTNGSTWTTVTSNFSSPGAKSVAFGNGLWVAGGYTGQMRISTNGSTWTTVTSNFGSSAINSIAYANNLWVAGGQSGQMRLSVPSTTTGDLVNILSKENNKKIATQYSAATIYKRAANEWVAIGDLTA